AGDELVIVQTHEVLKRRRGLVVRGVGGLVLGEGQPLGAELVKEGVQAVRAAVESHRELHARCLAHLGRGVDELVPCPDLVVEARGVGHPGLVPQVLVQEHAAGGAVAGQGRDLAVLVLRVHALDGLDLRGDVREVRGAVQPRRVQGGHAGESGQVVRAGGVGGLGGEAVRGDVDDLDLDGGLLLVLLRHRGVAAALVGVTGDDELQGLVGGAPSAAGASTAGGEGGGEGRGGGSGGEKGTAVHGGHGVISLRGDAASTWPGPPARRPCRSGGSGFRGANMIPTWKALCQDLSAGGSACREKYLVLVGLWGWGWGPTLRWARVSSIPVACVVEANGDAVAAAE